MRLTPTRDENGPRGCRAARRGAGGDWRYGRTERDGRTDVDRGLPYTGRRPPDDDRDVVWTGSVWIALGDWWPATRSVRSRQTHVTSRRQRRRRQRKQPADRQMPLSVIDYRRGWSHRRWCEFCSFGRCPDSSLKLSFAFGGHNNHASAKDASREMEEVFPFIIFIHRYENTPVAMKTNIKKI